MVMPPWMNRPSRTVPKYQASGQTVSPKSFISIIWPAMRKQTPTGAMWMIHVVTFIMTAVTLWKKCSSGLPSSPTLAMATPVTTENAISPRMFVPWLHSPANRHVFLSVSLTTKPAGSRLTPGPGYTRVVRYCCTVARTMLGGKQLRTRSISVSVVVKLRDRADGLGAEPPSALRTPGRMVVTSVMPRTTASAVVIA